MNWPLSLLLALNEIPGHFSMQKVSPWAVLPHNPSTAQDMEGDEWNTQVPSQGTKRIKTIIQDVDSS